MRELVTTLLDLVGLISVVLALALFVSRFGLPYAVLTFGVGILGVSALVTARAPKPREAD